MVREANTRDRSAAIVRYTTTPAFGRYRDIYADGVETRAGLRFLHTSGQVGIRSDGSTSQSFEEQCEQAIHNLIAVLDAAEMRPEHIVKLTCYVVGSRDVEILYGARRRLLPDVGPAVTTVIVQALASPEWLIEIEAIAAAS